MYITMIKLIIAMAICLSFPINGNRAEYGTYDNMCRVKKVHTPLTPIELGRALNVGHYERFGYYPSDKRLGVAWAQVALENGQGYYTYNYNFGKIKASKKHLHYVQKHRFRAHSNAIRGTTDYWNLINRLCKRSLPAFDVGAPKYAAKILSGCGYFEADKIKYGKAMRQLYNKALIDIIPNLDKEII